MYVPPLEGPPNEDLCDVLVVLACSFLQDGVVELAADEWAIGLDEDSVLSAVLNDLLLLAERVQLDLVDRWYLQTRLADLFEVLYSAGDLRTQCIGLSMPGMCNALVRNPDSPQLSSFLGLEQRSPRLEALLLAREWVVD